MFLCIACFGICYIILLVCGLLFFLFLQFACSVCIVFLLALHLFASVWLRVDYFVSSILSVYDVFSCQVEEGVTVVGILDVEMT
jgi:hypothetical protein